MSPAFANILNEFIADYQRGRTALVIWFWLQIILLAVVALFGIVAGFTAGPQAFILVPFGLVNMLTTYMLYRVFKAVLMMRDRMSLAAMEKAKNG